MIIETSISAERFGAFRVWADNEPHFHLEDILLEDRTCSDHTRSLQ